MLNEKDSLTRHEETDEAEGVGKYKIVADTDQDHL
jgi:hypothetical protein